MQKIKLVEATSPLSKMRWSAFASALNKSGMEWDWDSEWYGDGMLSLSKDGKTLDLTIEWEEGDDYNKYDIPRTLCDVSFTPYEDSVPESALDGVNQAKNIPALVRELEALVDRSASESRHPGTRSRPHAREAYSKEFYDAVLEEVFEANAAFKRALYSGAYDQLIQKLNPSGDKDGTAVGMALNYIVDAFIDANIPLGKPGMLIAYEDDLPSDEVDHRGIFKDAKGKTRYFVTYDGSDTFCVDKAEYDAAGSPDYTIDA